MVALEEGQDTIQPVPDEAVGERQKYSEEAAQGTSGPSEKPGAATQKIPVVGAKKKMVPEINVSREEQIQANLFSSLVVDEGAQRPLRKPSHKKYSWIVRLTASVLLIGLLSLSLFGSWPGDRFVNTTSGVEAMLASIAGGPELDSVLIVADYQAGFAEEIHQIAEPVLGAVLTPDMEILQISTQSASVLLSRRLLAGLPGGLNFRINDLGYYPSPVLGAYAAGGGTGKGISWAGLPETQSGKLPPDLDGVFILADSFEGASFWVEVLTARQPTLPLYLLATAQAGPMLRPYQDSGQVAALATGISGIKSTKPSIDEDGIALHFTTAYQTGTLLLAVMITLGAILSIKTRNGEEIEGDI